VLSRMELVDRVLAGDQRAIARAISVIEAETREAWELLRSLFRSAGKARIIGVTGSPGVGKSTLVDQLTTEWRRSGLTVGIIAIDPTSPYTGGAILGDRVRMQSHADDPGVYVRSMATRGHLGGLARATGDALLVLDASGKDVVVIETVGVGQGEVEVSGTADVSIVVTVPGTGDDVQAIKAGIMEIADIFVINKADRDGADRAVTEIENMLALGHERGRNTPGVFKTKAATGEGITELAEAIESVVVVSSRGKNRERERIRVRLRMILLDRFLRLVGPSRIDEAVEGIIKESANPYQVADEIIERLVSSTSAGSPLSVEDR